MPVDQTIELLLVDDDLDLRDAQIQRLGLAGLRVRGFDSAEAVLPELTPHVAAVLITDVRMGGMSGLDLATRARSIDPDLPVILMTGHGDIDMAVRALREGAFDFLTKPFGDDRLLPAVSRAMSQRRLVLENRRLNALLAAEPVRADRLLGTTPVMQHLRETLAVVARGDVDVVIEGESGSGKETVARELHRLSQRVGQPFVVVHCAGLSDEAVETELFGRPASGSIGRLTGGAFRAAGRGTVVLDEIDALSPALQAKVQHVVDKRTLPQLVHEAEPMDARIIATSRLDIMRMIADGGFRADLFYMLSTVRLQLPPLRHRRDDIEMLFRHFVVEGASRRGIPIPPHTTETLNYLAEHDWPGNVRELVQYAERHLLGLPAIGVSAGMADKSLKQLVDGFEARILREVLSECRGNVAEAVSILGIPRKTFYDKIKRHSIALAESRARNGASDRQDR